tara:strand:+ start:1094 stop:2275 length:1182 start_codon:yes stop_codon:yes gene_type:complete
MTSKKILINDYAGHPFITMLSSNLASKGFEVIHSYFADDLGPKGSMNDEKVKYVGVKNKTKYSKKNFFKRRYGDIEYGRNLSKLIEEELPDFIISSNTPLEAQEILLKTSKKIDSKFIFWCQDFYSIAAEKILSKKLGFIGTIIGKYYSYLEKRQFNLSDHIVSISEDFLKLFDRFNIPRKKISIIHNWGSINEINLVSKSNDWAQENNIDPNKFCILYSGTMGYKHNPKFIEALANRFEDINFLIVGTGIGFEYLENLKPKSNLILKPLQPMNRFSEVLGTADVCMAVLEDDAGIFSVPSKVLSYFCAGKPIIMHGPIENLASKLIIKNQCGLVSDGKNFEDLEKNILKIQNQINLKKMSENSYSYALKNFSIEEVSKKFLSIIEVKMKENK